MKCLFIIVINYFCLKLLPDTDKFSHDSAKTLVTY